MTERYHIDVTMGWLGDSFRAPKNVQHALRSRVFEQLEASPTITGGAIKKLHGYRHLWRFRIGDYRLIYSVKGEKVLLLMLGDRKDIYGRRFDKAESETDQNFGYLSSETSSEVAECPTAVTYKTGSFAKVHGEPSEIVDAPVRLTSDQLVAWGVGETYLQELTNCCTEAELFSARVPETVLSHVVECLFPRMLSESVNQRSFRVDGSEQLKRLLDAGEYLTEIMLHLNEEQVDVVRRTTSGQTGPWVIKGGPGSGKSTLALHCIRNLIEIGESQLQFEGPPKILYATHTRSLVRATDQMVTRLLGSKSKNVTVNTIGALGVKIIGPDQRSFIQNSDRKKIVSQAIKEAGISEPIDDAARDRAIEEFDCIITGNGINTCDEYLVADRTGRVRRMSNAQRERMWKVYEHYRRLMEEAELRTFEEVPMKALEAVRAGQSHPEFDYVFIDEAQDLKPISIRLCIALAKDARNVYLTADMNQCIYGRGVSWKSISSDLRFDASRSVTLTRNHRATTEIQLATAAICAELSDQDSETASATSGFRGHKPRIRECRDKAGEVAAIADFIFESSKALRIGYTCSCVLTRTNHHGQEIAKMLPRSLNARFMLTTDLDIDHPGVKVMTAHAAKGLQFPVVCVPRVQEGVFPYVSPADNVPVEELEAERRLFFVACSRAMLRLLVTYHGKPSQLLGNMNLAAWDTTARNAG